jgi:hypothetical protein
VLVLGEDYSYAATQYVQWAEGARTDVVVIDQGLLGFAWYRDRIARRGIAMPPATPTVGWVVEHALRAGHRVFVDLKQKDVMTGLPTYPYGAVLAVGTPPSLDDLIALERDLFGSFLFDYAPPGPDDEYASVIQRHYEAMWELLVRAVDAAGRHDAAAELRSASPIPR